MEGLEGRFARPRQVRYQAALRPDFIHSTSLPKREPLYVLWLFDTDAPASQPKFRSTVSNPPQMESMLWGWL